MINYGSTLTLRAYAKINWTLELLGRRTDGYHEVRTVLQNVSLWDQVTVTATALPSLEVHCPTSQVPTGPLNLCHRAASLLREAAGVHAGARIVIDKHIPVGAGLGGGSSNAAATLIALNRLWELHWSRTELAILAAQIGADVPFFLEGGMAVGTGRGDQIQPLPALIGVPLLLAIAPFSLATAAVYNQVRQFRAEAGASTRRLEELLARGEDREQKAKSEIASLLINDLEEPACTLQPELRSYLADLRQADVLAAGMSGSGPTLFALLKGSDDTPVRARLACWGKGWQATRVQTVGQGWEIG